MITTCVSILSDEADISEYFTWLRYSNASDSEQYTFFYHRESKTHKTFLYFA